MVSADRKDSRQDPKCDFRAGQWWKDCACLQVNALGERGQEPQWCCHFNSCLKTTPGRYRRSLPISRTSFRLQNHKCCHCPHWEAVGGLYSVFRVEANASYSNLRVTAAGHRACVSASSSCPHMRGWSAGSSARPPGKPQGVVRKPSTGTLLPNTDITPSNAGSPSQAVDGACWSP